MIMKIQVLFLNDCTQIKLFIGAFVQIVNLKIKT